MMSMKRANAVWNHPLYRQQLQELQQLEKDRRYCKHTPEHFLDVARLAYLFSMEQGLKLDKELIYTTALLHDIGRVEQYTMGIPHEQAGMQLAEPILKDCGFKEEEIGEIVAAIGSHRLKEQSGTLGKILYQADKKSRNCFLCKVRKECNWPDEKKNMNILY